MRDDRFGNFNRQRDIPAHHCSPIYCQKGSAPGFWNMRLAASFCPQAQDACGALMASIPIGGGGGHERQR